MIRNGRWMGWILLAVCMCLVGCQKEVTREDRWKYRDLPNAYELWKEADGHLLIGTVGDDGLLITENGTHCLGYEGDVTSFAVYDDRYLIFLYHKDNQILCSAIDTKTQEVFGPFEDDCEDQLTKWNLSVRQKWVETDSNPNRRK